ncbi:MAG: hypothetical protein KDC61_16905 [Saprospiraceae bacterium]|nr:hypothetical protein [Saprospiraceae bacterium]MCB0545187.1 hypothetical protein [Saprospiraceae bacterium]MCB0576237.1 hypothetical protein [Saprospiraceae bacterium]MCB9305469.1 hypothetical protein [Lewinellaceae bacterium]MCB9356111.1 hypothetical protein [Lewinellaceae bacterium]
MSKKLFLLPALLLGAFMMFTPACSDEDLCKDVDCGANGTCFDGDCVCDVGYEIGASGLCDTESRVKFYGNYNVTETCDTGNGSYASAISAGTSIDEINISNFGDSGFNVTAKVDGDEFSVSGVNLPNGVTVSATGSISGNTITLSYSGSGAVSFTCTATMTK